MAPYDALYVPRGGEVEVRPGPRAATSPRWRPAVEESVSLQFVAWKDVQKDPAALQGGAPPTERTLNILLGKNVEAGRRRPA